MTTNIKLARELLNNIASKESKPIFESLAQLVENLEAVNDPSPEKIQLVQLIYEYIEKRRILELTLKNFVKESNVETATGNLLDRLYDKYEKSDIFNS